MANTIVFKSREVSISNRIDGKWQLDYDNPISKPNGNGGVNSVINIINQIDKKPKLEFSFTNGKLKINNRMPKKYLFFGKSAYIFKEIILPKEAFKEAYSYLRAYSFNKYGESNNLLIPLKKGKVITNSQMLNPRINILK